jgi:hypothetical protein
LRPLRWNETISSSPLWECYAIVNMVWLSPYLECQAQSARVQQLEAEAEKGAKKTRELKLAKAALQVRCKTHVPHPLANRDGA